MPRYTRLPAVALAVALGTLAVQGCGGDAKTDGLAGMSAAAVQQRAAAALAAAGSVHYRGTSRGGAESADVRIQGDSSTGTLTIDGARLTVTRVAGTTYINASRRALTALGFPAAPARAGADRWLELAGKQLTSLHGFSAGDLAAQLTRNHLPARSRVQQSTLAGKEVLVVRGQDGSKLYVSGTGVPYPVRGEFKGRDAGSVEFNQYGADFGITAPQHALDVADLLARR